MNEAAQTRARILDAADALVLREGTSKLTMHGVAAEAGVSKGGVLYHFPSKEALITAMVARFAERYDVAVRGAESAQPEAKGRFTRSYASGSASASDQRADRVGAALLAAAANDPALLAPLKERYVAWQSALEADGIDPALATLVRLAVDGLWLAELLELAPPEPALKARVLALCDRLVKESP